MSVEEKKIETPICGALEEAIDHMKKAYEIMNQQALDLHKEKETFESVAKKLEHVHFASTIKLNVGGQHFTTSLQTLTKDTGSMLHAMFSGRFDTQGWIQSPLKTDLTSLIVMELTSGIF